MEPNISEKAHEPVRENSYALLSPIGGIVALVCFFMPWVGCMGQNVSGADAGGILWLVCLSAIGIVGAFFHFKSKRRLSAAKVPTIACATVGIAIMLLEYAAFKASDGSQFFTLKFGSIATLLGFAAAIYGATQLPRDD